MFHVSVGMPQLLGTIGIFLALGLVLLTGCFDEEGVVKLDDATGGTIVGGQTANLQLLLTMRELTVDGIQQSPVA